MGTTILHLKVVVIITLISTIILPYLFSSLKDNIRILRVQTLIMTVSSHVCPNIWAEIPVLKIALFLPREINRKYSICNRIYIIANLMFPVALRQLLWRICYADMYIQAYIGAYQ
jgi:hypothetical protein